MINKLSLLTLIAMASSALADPQLSSWYTADSTKYARVYTTDANAQAGTSATTWSNGTLSQTSPVYAGVQQISYSTNWVYFRTPDLASYIMGPWYNDATRTAIFINYPKNQNILYRIPRTSSLGTPPASKSVTFGSEDAVGYLVNGVAIFDCTDGFSYSNGSDVAGNSGQWHRAAYANESITFDYGNSHQQNTGKYHNHANPIALRYQLGDHVDFNSSTKKYSESTFPTMPHSPILGWMRDGLPIYGPYGYSSPMDSSSLVRRMVPGFVLRNGTSATGVDNIVTAGRTLPAWALRNNGNVSASGPAVSTNYPLGRYIEDWAYLGDLVKSGTAHYVQGVDFDLNEYNVRYCVTPEFPNGTYAYFMAIDSTGTPQMPYNINIYFFQTPTGGTASSISETVTTYFDGGPDTQEVSQIDSANSTSGDVTLSWSSVEGGTYKVEDSSDLISWATLSSSQSAASNAIRTSYIDSGAALSNSKRFYRVTRTALATYDSGTSSGSSEGISSVSPTSATHGTTTSLTITLNSSYTQAPPPASVQPTAVTLTKTGASTISSSSYSRNTSTGVVTASFSIPSNATTGTYTVNATFGPNTWSLTNGFTVK